MKAIITTEEEIKAFIDDLQLRKFELKTSFDPDVVHEIHRKFHYEVVKFFQNQGSSYPSK